MKKAFARLTVGCVGVAVMSTTLALTQLQNARAEDDSCFMVTSSGRRVSLGKLCNGGTVTNSGIHRAPIKRREGGTPVIDVTFNGKRTFEMLLDTGATGTVITASMAQALNVPIIGRARFELADGRSVILPIGQVRSISVAGAEIRDVTVAITSDDAGGLLGQDFVGGFDLSIKKQVVEFHRR